MPDVTIPNIYVSPASSPAQAESLAQALNNLVVEIPPIVATLPSGGSLEGQVSKNNDHRGAVVITTLHGELVVRTNYPLTTSDIVNFKIIKNNDNLLLQLISLNDQIIKEQPVFVVNNRAIPHAATQETNRQQVQLPADIVDDVNIKAISSLIETVFIAGNTEILEEIQPYLAEIYKKNESKISKNNREPQQSNLVKPGTIFKFKITDILSYGKTIDQLSNDTEEFSISSKEGKELHMPAIFMSDQFANTKTILLKTPIGFLRLASDIDLPLPSKIMLQLVEVSPPIPESSKFVDSKVLDRQEALVKIIDHWKALDDMLISFEKRLPQLAEKVLKTIIPSANSQLAAKLSLFIGAIRGGDIKQWLGKETTEGLNIVDSKHILANISQDFTILQQLFSDQNPGSWHTLLFPIYDGQKLHQAHMFIRKYKHNRPDDGEEENYTRFIVELDTDKLGDIQLDGLVHYRSGDIHKQLDLILRSIKELPAAFQEEVKAIFMSSQELTGLKGHISIQRVKEFAVKPLDEVLPHHVHSQEIIV